MKRFLKKCLICILIVMLVTNTILYTPGNVAYAGAVLDFLDNLSGGIIGILLWVVKAPILGALMGINSILTGIAALGGATDAGVVDGFFLTPVDIFFDEIEILKVNFLDLDTTNEIVKTFRTTVAGWYYSMRLIASMVLVVILIYIGIRMALSTVASEKVMYKKMLVDWVTSLALLFLLHYIMIFIFACNDALVNAMKIAANNQSAISGSVLPGQTSSMSTFMTNLVEQIFFSTEIWLGIGSLVVYGLMIFLTLTFLITYIKRMLTIGFLVIIAPLITITYSIDKIGDQKAQALNIWLKEFAYNILIQPFHCILYLSFGSVAMRLLTSDLSAGESSLAAAVLAILCILFIKSGEDLVKKIFGFDKATSVATMAANTAMAMAAVQHGGKIGAAAGKVTGKGIKMASKGVRKSIDKMQKSTNQLSKKIGNTLGDVREANQRKRASRAEDKLDDQARERVRKKFGGSIDENSERFFQEKEKARKEISKEREESAAKRKEITGKIGNAVKPVADGAKTVGKAVNNAVIKPVGKGVKYVGKGARAAYKAAEKGKAKFDQTDLGKYMSANSSKIMGAMVGIAGATIGLGGGVAGMTAGYKMGSGFMEGLMPNATKTIDKNIENAAQNYANLSGDTDINNILKEAKLLGENDGFKDMSKKIQELLNALNKLGVKNSATVVGNMSQAIAQDGNIDRDSLKQILLGANNEGMDEQTADKAVDLLSQQGKLMALESVYKGVNLAGEQGRGTDQIASKIGNLSTSNNKNSIDETDLQNIEITPEQVDVSNLTNSITRSLQTEVTTTVKEIDERITTIQTALQQMESLGDAQKVELTNSIRTKIDSFAEANVEQIKTSLQQQMQELERQREAMGG